MTSQQRLTTQKASLKELDEIERDLRALIDEAFEAGRDAEVLTLNGVLARLEQARAKVHLALNSILDAEEQADETGRGL